MVRCIFSHSNCHYSFSFSSSTQSAVNSPVTRGSAPLNWLQLCGGLEGLEAHVKQMTIRLWVLIGAGVSLVGIREDKSLCVGPVGQLVVELCQAGLQGVEALREDGGHWRGDGGGGGGGGRGGQSLALRVCLAVGQSQLLSFSWTFHPQEPRNPLQQDQVHLTNKHTKSVLLAADQLQACSVT